MPNKRYINSELRETILSETKQLKEDIRKLLKNYNEDQLNQKPKDGGWSAFECLQHLNLTYRSYLPNIHKGISRYNGPSAPDYKSGLLGDRMIRAMAPSSGEVPADKKVKTFKKINPDDQPKFDTNPVELFMQYTDDFEAIVNKMEDYNLGKTHVTSLAGPLIRFKLGDALQIVHVHNKRHIIQAKNALNDLI